MRSQPPAPTTAVSAPPWLSSLTRPSRMWTTRSAISVETGSWLTTIAAERCSDDELGQEREHLAGGLRVEVARRLVGDEELRAIGQRRAERDALLLSARELGRPGVGAVEQADALEQLPSSNAALALPGRPRARAARRRAPPPSARQPAHASSAGRRTRGRPAGSGRARAATRARDRAPPPRASRPTGGRARRERA